MSQSDHNNWQYIFQEVTYVRENFLPALVESAVEQKRLSAVSYLGWILLEMCLAKQINPLKALRGPVTTLTTKLKMEAVKSSDELLSDLFFDEGLGVIQEVVRYKKEKLCDKSKDKCIHAQTCLLAAQLPSGCANPTLYFWNLLLNLAKPNSLKDLEELLEIATKILRKPETICRTKWGLTIGDETKELLWILGGLYAICSHLNEDGQKDMLFPPNLLDEIKRITGQKLPNSNSSSILTIYHQNYKRDDDGIKSARAATEQAPTLERRIFHFLLTEASEL